MRADRSQIAAVVHDQVLHAGADPAGPGFSTDLGRTVRRADPLLSGGEVTAVVEEVLARVDGLGALGPMLADQTVTEVMVNGDGGVWLERRGELHRTSLVLDPPAVAHIIERIIGPLGLRVDRTVPMVDARLSDGSRVHAAIPPVAVDGPTLTIRRFGAKVHAVHDFCVPSTAELLVRSVEHRANVIVIGGTGSGKTTLLNALAGHIQAGERVITIEDAAELRLDHGHVVRLEARLANAEGVGEVTIRDLVRNALRMRPDRIVVGEVRGPEALDMLLALNTGHDGSLSTCHANGPGDLLSRLETLCLLAGSGLGPRAIRRQIHAAVDLVVQVERGESGGRRVGAVAELVGPDELTDGDDRLEARLRPLYTPEREGADPSRPWAER